MRIKAEEMPGSTQTCAGVDGEQEGGEAARTIRRARPSVVRGWILSSRIGDHGKV